MNAAGTARGDVGEGCESIERPKSVAPKTVGQRTERAQRCAAAQRQSREVRCFLGVKCAQRRALGWQ